MSAKKTLIFIPLPVLSHLLATIKLANLLTDHDENLSITFIIINLNSDTKISSFTKNSPNSRVNFVHLARDDSGESPGASFFQIIDSQKAAVKSAVAAAGGGRIAGVVFDILCASMMDVAAELGAPSYIFFTCGAAILGLIFRLAGMIAGGGAAARALAEYEGSDAEIPVPTYVNPVPAKVWPTDAFDAGDRIAGVAGMLRRADGILVNTYVEIEGHAISALAADGEAPAVYPVGPVLHASDDDDGRRAEILGWLDGQPDASVVYLCFGTNVALGRDQVAEIAAALEGSGRRFLWSLRKPSSGGGIGEYEDPDEVLPKGFLERTAEVGRVIGWAPQMAVLAHPAVGGFVTHCGWNSVLESVSCGVPMAVWPMFAEQQSNAFLLVKELEIAVEIKMDYRISSPVIVDAGIIEKGIIKLMDPENKIRANVKELMEKSRNVLTKGGSSYNYVHRFIEDATGKLNY